MVARTFGTFGFVGRAVSTALKLFVALVVPGFSCYALLENGDFDQGLRGWISEGQVEPDPTGLVLTEGSIGAAVYQPVVADGRTYELQIDVCMDGLAGGGGVGPFDQVKIQIIGGYDVISLSPAFAEKKWDVFVGSASDGPRGTLANAQIRPNPLLGPGWFSGVAEITVDLPAIAPVVSLIDLDARLDSSLRLARVQLVAVEPGKLVNLSVNGLVGTGPDVLITGIVIGGVGSKPFLFRGGGPSLIQFGAKDWLKDPVLALFQNVSTAPAGVVQVGANDDWDEGWDPDFSAVDLRAVFASVGAFDFFEGQKDAALYVKDLPPGAYTTRISGQDDTSGLSLTEIYDLDPDRDSPTELVNLSCRSVISNRGDSQIPGFVIGGDRGRILLVRTVGPGLEQFGVEGAISDPTIELYQKLDTGWSQPFGYNDDWTDATNVAAIREVSARVGAFPLSEGSKDSAILTAVPPGVFTVSVRSTVEERGVGLVEIYLVKGNRRPIAFHKTAYARDHVVALPQNEALAIAYDPDGDSLRLGSFTQPEIGSVAVYSGGDLVFYVSESDLIGETAFNYTVTDGEFESAPAVMAVQMISNETCVWKQGRSGRFQDPENWVEGRVPGVDDPAWISEQGRYSVTVEQDTSVASLKLGAIGAEVTMVVESGRALTVGSDPVVVEGSLLVYEDEEAGN